MQERVEGRQIAGDWPLFPLVARGQHVPLQGEHDKSSVELGALREARVHLMDARWHPWLPLGAVLDDIALEHMDAAGVASLFT